MSPSLPAPERRIFRAAAVAALLAALALGAFGRFREAAALTAGAAVAIVSGLWLSDVAGRLLVPRPRAATRNDWKFALRALLRYGFIGLATSADLTAWARFEKNPILSPKDGASWEKGTLYKSFLFRGPAGKFYLFYNAKDSLGGPWVEATGLATSDDLASWKREASNPILPHGPEGAWDSAFASDPIVFHHRFHPEVPLDSGERIDHDVDLHGYLL